MNFGLTRNESNEAYHSAEAISHSRLEVFRKRPELYRRQYITKTVPRETTAALTFGNAFHKLILEGEGVFASKFARKPDGIDRRTTVGKAEWAKFCLDNAGKEVLDGDDFLTLGKMRAAVMANRTAAELLSKGEAELTWRSKVSALPIPAQCRTDWFNPDGCSLSGGRPYVLDVKTVETLDEFEFRNFTKSFYKLGYHRQSGFYIPVLQDCGVTVTDWFFAVVEKQEPFGCIVYRPTERSIDVGVNESVSDLQSLAECYRTNVFPNMPEGVHAVDLPTWYGKDAA